MRYMLLIHSSEAKEAERAQNPAVQQAYHGAWMTYTGDLQGSGLMENGEALQPTTTATTVRVQDGKTLTTDGPYIETKEALGGFYVVNAPNLDEAIAWASKMPHVAH